MLAPIENHPTDDQNYPSFQCQAYKDISSYLDYVSAMEQGKDAWLDLYGNIKDQKIAEKMLPIFPEEEIDDWKWRVKIAPWKDLFKPALEKIPGFMNKIEASRSVFERLRIDMSDIDMASNSLKRVSTLADYVLLRDQLVFVFVDFHNPDKKVISPAEITSEKDIRPFLKIIDRRNVPNWQYSNNKFEYIVIREAFQGNYRYREIKIDGSWKLFEIHQNNDKELSVVKVDEGKNSLGYIPVLLYSHDAMSPFTSLPPMMPIARLQKEHYEQCSEARYAQWKQGFSTLIISGASQGDSLDNKFSKEKKKIRKGVNYAIELDDHQASATYIHPDVSWFNVYQAALATIEERVKELTETFVGENEANRIYKSRLEVDLQETNDKSMLTILMEAKLSLLDQIEKIWCDYYGIPQKYMEGKFNNFEFTKPDNQTENKLLTSQSDRTEHSDQ